MHVIGSCWPKSFSWLHSVLAYMIWNSLCPISSLSSDENCTSIICSPNLLRQIITNDVLSLQLASTFLRFNDLLESNEASIQQLHILPYSLSLSTGKNPVVFLTFSSSDLPFFIPISLLLHNYSILLSEFLLCYWVGFCFLMSFLVLFCSFCLRFSKASLLPNPNSYACFLAIVFLPEFFFLPHSGMLLDACDILLISKTCNP